MFCLLDNSFENFPILNYLGEPIISQFYLTLLVLPYFEIFSNINIMLYTSPPIQKLHPCSDIIFQLYKSAFHGRDTPI